MKVRIRGIYATALTYLFLKSGYTIVQQTPQIVERFGIEASNEPADITVKDGIDKGEIVSIGGDIYEFLRSTFKYSSVWKSPVKLYSVIEPEGCEYMGYRVEPCIEKGTIIKPPVEGKIVLSPARAVGKVAMVWRGEGKTFFSEHIKEEMKEKLLAISLPLNKKGYNIKWRSNAIFVPASELKKELESLVMRYESGDFRNQGEEFIRVILSLEDKLFLDGIRSLVVKTMKFHHMLKYSYHHNEVDEEEQNEKPDPIPLLKGLIRDTMAIEHVKADGRKYTLREGKVIYSEINKDFYVIRLKREFKGRGNYDGLEIPIENGDYDIVEFDSRQWYQLHRYFSAEGELKGIYANISTPPELLQGKIRYLDLEVDVIKKGNEIRVIDLEELEKKKELLGEELYKKAVLTSESIKNSLMSL
ncbi:DUF402 domain-containing protein [Stygiolobus caldivivus]|nr:DUF402 domain-containing protein [Stygiolobus caldivivus]